VANDFNPAPPEPSPPASRSLAAELRRWIVIAGYVLGGWAIVQSALNLAAWGLPFNFSYGIGVLEPIDRVAKVLHLLAPLLLVAGCWGFQHHRPWARPVLLTYAGTWVVGLFGVLGVSVVDTMSGSYGDLTSRQMFTMALNRLDIFVYASVYPVVLVLCLMRPEVRDQFPEFRGGFAPVMDDKQ
jgi:hypothetical protein